MDRDMLLIKAHRHWEMWLPEKTRKLKNAGQFEAAIQTAVARADAEFHKLVTRGYKKGEAKDIALPKYICLKAESHEYD